MSVKSALNVKKKKIEIVYFKTSLCCSLQSKVFNCILKEDNYFTKFSVFFSNVYFYPCVKEI